MAVQLHVAYSASFGKGAAVIAGGPFNCAEGSIVNGLTRCLGNAPIPVADLVEHGFSRDLGRGEERRPLGTPRVR